MKICKDRTCCKTCRDKEGGRPWRESVRRVFDLPGGTVDFECPHGKPWGYAGEWTPEQTSRGLGDTIAKVTSAVGIKPCGGCKERQKKLNELIPYGGNSHG